jgi:hypothetical protein
MSEEFFPGFDRPDALDAHDGAPSRVFHVAVDGIVAAEMMINLLGNGIFSISLSEGNG